MRVTIFSYSILFELFTISFNLSIPLFENLKTYYMQINDLGNRAVIINGQDVFKYPLKHWKTNFQNEYARAVLLNDCYLVRLESKNNE